MKDNIDCMFDELTKADLCKWNNDCTRDSCDGCPGENYEGEDSMDTFQFDDKESILKIREFF